MRCIFCKAESSASRSIEHILPESIGNSKLLLPKGVVCDKCNNYFAKAVEKPFLEAEAVRQMRFHEGLPSKKGRVPSIVGLLDPDVPVRLFRDAKDRALSAAVPTEHFGRLAERPEGRLLMPMGGAPPSGTVLSRFFAKVATESMAARLTYDPRLLEQFIDDPQLDPLRNHARRGQPLDWSVHVRRIYPANARTLGPDGSWGQVMHESDFLVTPRQEIYFAQAIFGIEYTINIGGPDVDGYLEWLDANNQASPLYAPKNLELYEMPAPRPG
ncbi:MAG: HNH endonuclease [Phenylobacterium sp.]|uniref:HNH endonuclease n=1 Tax=Phenylobacterium sp. TaxID=1871053 RepID=UPI0025FD209E|nr:HNH endonuclease [Phenylobacterium sp.]MBI1198708.1 HNH endonuclease [Phenylobacterium sp.]